MPSPPLRPSGRAALAYLFGEDWETTPEYPVAMWPDSSSLARIMVAKLMPHAAPDVTAGNVAIAASTMPRWTEKTLTCDCDSCTVIGVDNTDPCHRRILRRETQTGFARHAVLAAITASSSPLPHNARHAKDRAAISGQSAFDFDNVLLRNSEALDKLGADAISC